MKRDGDDIIAFDRGDVVWGVDPFTGDGSEYRLSRKDCPPSSGG